MDRQAPFVAVITTGLAVWGWLHAFNSQQYAVSHAPVAFTGAPRVASVSPSQPVHTNFDPGLGYNPAGVFDSFSTRDGVHDVDHDTIFVTLTTQDASPVAQSSSSNLLDFLSSLPVLLPLLNTLWSFKWLFFAFGRFWLKLIEFVAEFKGEYGIGLPDIDDEEKVAVGTDDNKKSLESKNEAPPSPPTPAQILQSLQTQITAAQSQLTAIVQRTDKLTSSYDVLAAQRDSLTTAYEDHARDLDTAHTNNLADLNTAHANNLTDLATRASTVENRMTGLGRRMEKVEAALDQADQVQDAALDEITALQGKIDDLKGNVRGLEGSVEQSQNFVAGLDSRIDGAATKLNKAITEQEKKFADAIAGTASEAADLMSVLKENDTIMKKKKMADKLAEVDSIIDAKLEKRWASIDAAHKKKMDELDGKVDAKLMQLNSKIDAVAKRETEIRTKVDATLTGVITRITSDLATQRKTIDKQLSDTAERLVNAESSQKAGLDSSIKTKLADLDSRLDAKLTNFADKIDTKLDELDTKINKQIGEAAEHLVDTEKTHKTVLDSQLKALTDKVDKKEESLTNNMEGLQYMVDQQDEFFKSVKADFDAALAKARDLLTQDFRSCRCGTSTRGSTTLAEQTIEAGDEETATTEVIDEEKTTTAGETPAVETAPDVNGDAAQPELESEAPILPATLSVEASDANTASTPQVLPPVLSAGPAGPDIASSPSVLVLAPSIEGLTNDPLSSNQDSTGNQSSQTAAINQPSGVLTSTPAPSQPPFSFAAESAGFVFSIPVMRPFLPVVFPPGAWKRPCFGDPSAETADEEHHYAPGMPSGDGKPLQSVASDPLPPATPALDKGTSTSSPSDNTASQTPASDNGSSSTGKSKGNRGTRSGKKVKERMAKKAAAKLARETEVEAEAESAAVAATEGDAVAVADPVGGTAAVAAPVVPVVAVPVPVDQTPAVEATSDTVVEKKPAPDTEAKTKPTSDTLTSETPS